VAAPAKISLLKRTRIVSQTVFLAVFFVLLMKTEYHGEDVIGYPVKIFLELDPLILITTFLASHAVTAGMFLSLITVVITLVLGRVFCGWFCPLGALNDFVGSFRRKRVPKETKLDKRGIKFKYYVLIGILIAAVFGFHFAGVMDPISLTVRSFAVAIAPALDYIVHGLFDLLYRTDVGWIVSLSEPTYEFLRAHVISFERPAFIQGGFIGLLFITILLLNFVRRRFWCRFLCPLGALLGLLSRFSLLNHKLDEESCDNCKLCLTTCAGGARPTAEAGQWRGSECVMCMSCESICPQQAIRYQFGKPKPDERRTDLKRRYLLGAGAAGVAGLAVFRVSPGRAHANPKLIRPPGSVEEDEFLRRCVKCGECMKVCITNGLQPTLFQAGFEGLWSPVLVPRLGYCEYNCTLCGQVCPTDAIVELETEVKRNTKIGLAFLDKNRCLPHAFDVDCIVCEEHCPTDPKAIYFETKIVEDTAEGRELKLPVVNPHKCIGCGICEYVCPVGEQAAIRVTSVGEDRSDTNRIFL
jgi:MauM/NapG family ferredoxin protein